MLHSCQHHLDKMQRPVSVFLTMETEEGRIRAERYNEMVEYIEFEEYNTLLGEKIDIQTACEPTDIIWENRHFTPVSIKIRSFLAVTLLMILLGMSFSIIFYMQRWSMFYLKKYPQ